MQLRVRALETILTEKGYVDPAALDQIVENFETKIGPHIGARVVARAWVDPEFKRRLLADATEAVNSVAEFDPVAAHLIAVENTPQTHNVVVCTLCSCYPWPVLGLPPVWYKSAPYRSRTVIDPKGVLADFGVTLPSGTDIRIWDSTAETRFLVVPMRPAGTDGWSEERLADNRDPRQHGRHRPAESARRGRGERRDDETRSTIWVACTALARSSPSRTSRCSTRSGRGGSMRCRARWVQPACGRSTAVAPRWKTCRRSPI